MRREVDRVGVLTSPDGVADQATNDMVLARLSRARTIVVSPEQAMAAATPIGHSAASLSLPFDDVLFDFGSGLRVEAYGESQPPKMIGTLVHAGDDRSIDLMRTFDPGGYMVTDMPLELDASPTLLDGPRIYEMIDGLLNLLECVNVELVESEPYPHGHVAADQPRYEVVIRVGKRKAYPARDEHQRVDYSHRFEVRGNFAHHYELTIDGRPNVHFQRMLGRRPEKLVEVVDPETGVKRPCFRVWRPDYVKGPDDKPLVPKVRIVR